MKVKEYVEENGYITIILANEEEYLCFINPNIYNGGEWKLNSYRKSVYNKPNESFNIVIARYGDKENTSYIMAYASDNYTRMIGCDINDIVKGDVIHSNEVKHTSYYPNPSELNVPINEYAKENREYHDEKSNVFTGNLDMSSKAILKCVEYTKKYGEILKEMEPQLRMDISEINKIKR